MKNKKLVLMPLLALVLIVGAAFMANTKITVKGSDTLVILAQRWAEIYMKENPETSIQVTGGGSGVGIAALINGTTDIANSSRPIKSTEVEKIKARYNTLGIEIPCAKDGITIFLNESNKVQELTLKQLSDIYQAKVTNWKQVGGEDAPIKLYGRENSSGTYVFFKEEVVKGGLRSYVPDTTRHGGCGKCGEKRQIWDWVWRSGLCFRRKTLQGEKGCTISRHPANSRNYCQKRVSHYQVPVYVSQKPAHRGYEKVYRLDP